MAEKTTMLEKLEERKKKIDAEIKKAKSEQAKKEKVIYDEKCRIVGAAILLECEHNNAFKETTAAIIEKQTLNSKDRKTYGLDPLPKKDKKETASGL